MKKVLLIGYHFPPDAAVGGLRAQKFAKYLPFYGWPDSIRHSERDSNYPQLKYFGAFLIILLS